jgi:hypothetical protein
MTALKVKPSQEEIELVQMLAEDKGAMDIAVKYGWASNKAYNKLSMLKSKYGFKNEAAVVYLFTKNKFLK